MIKKKKKKKKTSVPWWINGVFWISHLTLVDLSS